MYSPQTYTKALNCEPNSNLKENTELSNLH